MINYVVVVFNIYVLAFINLKPLELNKELVSNYEKKVWGYADQRRSRREIILDFMTHDVT